MIDRRAFSLSLLAAPACAAQPAAQPGWREAPGSPYPVQEIYPALFDNRIWIAGGFSPLALGATKRVIAFDLPQQRWFDAPDLPERAHHVHLAALGNTLYAVGGFLGGDTGRRWIATPRVLRLAGEGWAPAPPLPGPLAEGVPLVHEGRIHLIGGRAPPARRTRRGTTRPMSTCTTCSTAARVRAPRRCRWRATRRRARC